MTNERAIEVIKEIHGWAEGWDPDQDEALDMAIEALQRGLENVNADSCLEIPNRSDLIHRQDAIDIVNATYESVWAEDSQDWVIMGLEILPSAQPERKKGKWDIWRDCEGKSRYVTCNICGHKEFNWYDPNFCPSCGAEMEGGER